MQNSYIPLATETKYAQVPDSKVLFSRGFALLIDSFVIAVIIWLATRSFGTYQLVTSAQQFSSNAAIPGSIANTGGTSFGANNLSWVVKIPVFWSGVLVFLYFVLQEALFGATLGKAMTGLCVIYQRADNSYTNLTLTAAVVRNLVRFLDALPSVYLVGWITALISSRRQRLGDLAAHTLVVNRESVPYLGRSRKQIIRGFLVIAGVLLAFTIICQTFSYFGRPPIVIQNDVIINRLFPDQHITRYTLGAKTWGHDEEGNRTVTYPINFTSTDLTSIQPGRLQSCRGSITLGWHWSEMDWSEGFSNSTCTDL